MSYKIRTKMIIINSRILQFFLFFFLTFQIGYSQVDLVYTDLVWSDEFDVNGLSKAQ